MSKEPQGITGPEATWWERDAHEGEVENARTPLKRMGGGEDSPGLLLPAQDSDGGRAPTPVNGLIVPVLLAVCSSSGHVGAPHNCLQSLHKAFAELPLQKRNTLLESLRGTWGPVAGPGVGEGLPALLASLHPTDTTPRASS